jgi:hypothetical protein
MDVYLIPTTTSERYELYYEAPDEDDVVSADEEAPAWTRWVPGLLLRWGHRVKIRFDEALEEAEDWRHRRIEEAPAPQGVVARARRKVMGFIVERIAEQRLLWHMRRAQQICARIPADMTEGDANLVIRAALKKDLDHHFKWIFIDLLLLIMTAPLFFIPGPNVPGFYFTFQVVGHFLSWQGAKQGLACPEWTFKPSTDLSELRAAMAMAPPERHRRFRELGARLRLEHLETFCEDVAAPTA